MARNIVEIRCFVVIEIPCETGLIGMERVVIVGFVLYGMERACEKAH